jgi:hypothetical protein
MNNEHEINKVEKVSKQSEETTAEETPGEGEFKLTVRKLELPVRPRGVLAE